MSVKEEKDLEKVKEEVTKLTSELTLEEVTEMMLKLDVTDYINEKNKLSYLSWANAFREALKIDPSFEHNILKNEDNLPIFGTPELGYLVYTNVTFQGKTRECWLPVMDGANKVMKDEAYTFDTKWKKNVPVEAMDMFSINKTVMRCLTKNLALFGLGLYIYAGEDLPEDPEVTGTVSKPQANKTTTEAPKKTTEATKTETKPEAPIDTNAVKKYISSLPKEKKDAVLEKYGVESPWKMKLADIKDYIASNKKK